MGKNVKVRHAFNHKKTTPDSSEPLKSHKSQNIYIFIHTHTDIFTLKVISVDQLVALDTSLLFCKCFKKFDV